MCRLMLSCAWKMREVISLYMVSKTLEHVGEVEGGHVDPTPRDDPPQGVYHEGG